MMSEITGARSVWKWNNDEGEDQRRTEVLKEHFNADRIVWVMSPDVAREIAEMIERGYGASDGARDDARALRMEADRIDPPIGDSNDQ